MFSKNMMAPAIAILVAGILSMTTGLYAAGFKDSELAQRAQDGYLEKKNYSARDHRVVHRVSNRKTDFQAIALERLKDNVVVVSYAGTNPKEIGDVLADLGLTAKEIEHMLNSGVFNLTKTFEKAKWIPKGSADKVRKAFAGEYGGLKISRTKATYRGKLSTKCPKGSFFDPRNGGECWSCSSGTHRTVFAVTSGKACEKRANTSYKKAKKERKNSRVGQGCPKRQFWDVKGGNGLLGACYSCPSGYKRSASSVTSSKACFRVSKLSWSKAKYVSKLLCPKGTFFDPINKGTCWSCPRGHIRSLASVKANDACHDISWQKKANTLFNAGFKVNDVTEKQLKNAREFLTAVLKKKDSKGRQVSTKRLIVTGHSLGGFIAQVIAYERKSMGCNLQCTGGNGLQERCEKQTDQEYRAAR